MTAEGWFSTCPACGRCSCGAVHPEGEHPGRPQAVPEQESLELVDPSIGTDTLLALLLSADEPEQAIANVCAYAERLHALVRWFALAYRNKEPVWLSHDLYGNELSDNQSLAATWRAVMGGDA